MATRGNTPTPADAGTEPKVLIGRISDELSQAAADCGGLQILISSLLEKTNHPDLASEFRMLQDMDRLQQTLADLSDLLKAFSLHIPAGAEQVEKLVSTLRLTSLQTRLAPRSSCDLAQSEENNVTWF